MEFTRATSSRLHNDANVTRVMRDVLLALCPGIAIYFYFFGWSILINISIAIITALCAESVMLTMRQRPIAPFLKDYSAVLTAVLLALALPTLAPWWLIVIATLFAIVIAKHLYGGLGYNPFNPAMVGYVVVMISFPQYMTQWLLPNQDLGLMQTLALHFQQAAYHGLPVDSITAATPIDSLKTGLSLDKTVSDIRSAAVFGQIGGRGWEWIGGGFLLGGLWLIFRKLIGWQIPLSMLGSIILIAGLFNLLDPDHYANPLVHLFSGGTLLAAFFIATDPVTASTTPKGRVIYAAGIGLLTYVIRNWGGFPDGIAFAVLLMNMAVPTIDYYTQPRVFGAAGK